MARTALPAESTHLAYLLVQPSRPQLITTINTRGSVNVSPAGWVTAVSQNPPMFAAAFLSRPKKKRTIRNIEDTGEFVINAPGIDIAGRLIACSYDYPDEFSKFEMGGFTPIPSLKVVPPGIAQCRASLECRVRRTIPTGDHTLVIADLLAAHYDTRCFTPDLMPLLDTKFPCLNVKKFAQDKGQSHLLLAPTGLKAIYVPYDPKERDHITDRNA